MPQIPWILGYQSGEFPIHNIDGRIRAATVFNNTIFVLSPYPEFVAQTTFDLNNLKRTKAPVGEDPLNAEALTDPKNWLTQNVNLPETIAKPGLVSFAGSMFCFLNSMSQGFIASKLSLSGDDGQPGTWGKPINLLESDGKTPISAPMAASTDATIVGENIVIVTCGFATSATNAVGGTFVAIYDTNDIDSDRNTWASQFHAYLPFQSQVDTGHLPTNVSVEWYSTVGASGKDTDPPDYRLVVLVQMISGAATVDVLRPWFLPMTVSTPEVGLTKVTLTVPSGPIEGPPGMTYFSPLVRDPASRLRVWMCDGIHQRGEAAPFTAALIGTDDNHRQDQYFKFGTTSNILQASDASILPCSLFYVFEPGKSLITVDGKPVVEYPAYEFVFYGTQGLCQVSRCGSLQVFPDFAVKHPNEELPKPLDIVAGIIDGPIPLPIENFQGFELGPGQTNAGSTIYGLTDATTESRQVSDSWSVGFETKGKVSKGIGVAWDISFKGGMGSVTAQSASSSLSYALTQKAIIVAEHEKDPRTIVSSGVLKQVGAQLSITAFNYIDYFSYGVDSTSAAPANAAKPAVVLATMISPSVINFQPYYATPGVLSSYTPEEINKKMKALGYAGDNYFGEVICQNAYPFADQTNPHLSYSWSADGVSGQTFTRFETSYKESSWSLDLHAYGGVSGGTGASVFGMGEEAQWEVLAGVDYSHVSTQSENKQTGWGVGLSETWGPPFRSDVLDSVASYDFRVFFLPVPKPPSILTAAYWTQELMKYSGTTQPLDPNSGCWRIVYAVTKIVYTDSQRKPYLYDGAQDMDSVYSVE
jgi:hypothetical protein